MKFSELDINEPFEVYGDEHLNYDYPKICSCIKINDNTGQELGGIYFAMGENDEVTSEKVQEKVKKSKKLYRNYCSDSPAEYVKIYQAICDCFDEHQKDLDGVEYSVMIGYIMKATRGSSNPMKIQIILKEFER